MSALDQMSLSPQFLPLCIYRTCNVQPQCYSSYAGHPDSLKLTIRQAHLKKKKKKIISISVKRDIVKTSARIQTCSIDKIYLQTSHALWGQHRHRTLIPAWNQTHSLQTRNSHLTSTAIATGAAPCSAAAAVAIVVVIQDLLAASAVGETAAVFDRRSVDHSPQHCWTASGALLTCQWHWTH